MPSNERYFTSWLIPQVVWENCIQANIWAMADEPAEDKPADAPAEDKPVEDKSAVDDKSAEDKPAEGKPVEDKPAAAAKPWYQERIDELTKARREAERALASEKAATQLKDATIDELKTKIATGAAAEEKPVDAAAGDARLTQQEIDRRARAIAEATVAQQEFDRRANVLVENGKAEFQDFDARMSQVGALFDREDPASMQRLGTFIDAVIEAGGDEAHKILHDLGGNPDEAMRISRLTPTKMASELTRIALGQKPLTKAPAPLRVPRGNNTNTSPIDPTDADRADNLSTAEWMKRRDAQLKRA